MYLGWLKELRGRRDSDLPLFLMCLHVMTATVPCHAVLVWKLILSVGCPSLLQANEDRLSMGILHVILV